MHYRHDEQTDDQGKRTVSSTIRVPRYHQHRGVNRREGAVKQQGSGTNYPIQHSVGIGKTDSIAWTAHLHEANNQPAFQTVLGVSDRTVLDGQLWKAVDQLAYVAGVFAALIGRRYAVIADEAHSSQTSSATRKLKEVSNSRKC